MFCIPRIGVICICKLSTTNRTDHASIVQEKCDSCMCVCVWVCVCVCVQEKCVHVPALQCQAAITTEQSRPAALTDKKGSARQALLSLNPSKMGVCVGVCWWV